MGNIGEQDSRLTLPVPIWISSGKGMTGLLWLVITVNVGGITGRSSRSNMFTLSCDWVLKKEQNKNESVLFNAVKNYKVVFTRFWTSVSI